MDHGRTDLEPWYPEPRPQAQAQSEQRSLPQSQAQSEQQSLPQSQAQSQSQPKPQPQPQPQAQRPRGRTSWLPRLEEPDLWRPADSAARAGSEADGRAGGNGGSALADEPEPRHVGRSGEHRRSASRVEGRARINEDVDLDELDPHGRARQRAAARTARTVGAHPRRRRAFKATAAIGAGVILAVTALGGYAYEHLFGQVATESLDSLTDRPAAARADR
jgi:hypothetical protein